MVRPEGWEKRFSEYLKEAQNLEFVWGEFDCIMFAAKGLEVITGQNFYQEYVGYTDEAGAKALIEQAGSIDKLVSKHLGPSHGNRLQARRGDLVLLRLPELTLGIIDDTGQKVAAISHKGYVRIPLIKAHRIWSY